MAATKRRKMVNLSQMAASQDKNTKKPGINIRIMISSSR